MQGNAKDFLKPKLIESSQTATNEFKIVLEPLEKGFGHTNGYWLFQALTAKLPRPVCLLGYLIMLDTIQVF